jgi:capsular polysaccharide export protein
MTGRLGIVGKQVWTFRGEIEAVLGLEPVRIGYGRPTRLAAVAGWADGRGALARRVAQALRVPFRPVLEGPLRSVRPDPAIAPASLLLGAPILPVNAGRAEAGLALWRRLRLSWRNDGRDRLPEELAGREAIRVVVAGPGTSWPTLPPGGQAVVLAEPGTPRGIAEALVRRISGAVLATRVNPAALFDAALSIHAGPGRMAREARMAGHAVVAMGPEPAEEGSALHLFTRHVLAEPNYFDAWSRRPTDFETAADQLAWQRDRFLENDRPSFCLGISRWKRGQVARFLDGPDGPPVFASSVDAAIQSARAERGRAVAWETRMPALLPARAAAADVPLVRMEDGFLRSVGLGAAFMPGASAVLDERGIYYDPRSASDLEHILGSADFPPALLERARRLTDRIVALRLSKYNVGRAAGALGWPPGRPIVLVPGQVEDDASVMFGSPSVRRNLDLLAAARLRRPEAFVVFKPHPDVVAGLRQGAVAESDALAYADQIVADASIVDLLEHVDEVETMTSLAGFEALMRGRRVVVQGQPFYAGWGLTEDVHPPTRRPRKLSLDQLVAAALILYPRYIDPVTGLRCPPEVLVDRLAEARDTARAVSPTRTAARALYVRARYALLGPLATQLRRARGSLRSNPASPQE